MNDKLLAAMGLVNRKIGKTIITYPDINRWCNKLMRYLNISRKMAEKIACSKLVYYAANYTNLVKVLDNDTVNLNESLVTYIKNRLN